jgi:hypothetical protein
MIVRGYGFEVTHFRLYVEGKQRRRGGGGLYTRPHGT